MLRATLLATGGVMLATAAFGALTCWRLSAVIPLAVWGAVLAGGVMVERWRYRPLSDHPPGDDWQATRERFVDAESGRPVTVFFNPATGVYLRLRDMRRRQPSRHIRPMAPTANPWPRQSPRQPRRPCRGNPRANTRLQMLI